MTPEQSEYRNAVMRKASAIFFVPLVLSTVLWLGTACLVEANLCAWGTEFRPYTRGSGGEWKCREVPGIVMLFPILWFFGMQPFVHYYLHWSHNQFNDKL